MILSPHSVWSTKIEIYSFGGLILHGDMEVEPVSPGFLIRKPKTQSFQLWMSSSLYIILKHISWSNTSVLHRFMLINLPKKKKPYFASSTVWAKLSELGRALKAFKFATICKVCSDWPLFIGPLRSLSYDMSRPLRTWRHVNRYMLTRVTMEH